MAFSGVTTRSKSQESPVLWLSFVAGSLVVHLAAILIGRWYFSQTANAPAGGTQAPLDFVEIDPNVSPSRGVKSIAPSNTPTQSQLPKVVPPQTSETEAAQAPNSIANLPRQTAQERSQVRPTPSPTPTTPVTQSNRVQPSIPSRQFPTESSKPTRSPASTPSPSPTPSNERSNSSSTSPSGEAVPDRANSGGASSGGSNASQPSSATSGGSTDSTAPSQGSTNSGQNSGSSPVGGGTSLSGEATFQGKIAQTLERDPNERQKDGALSITVRNESLPPITVNFPPRFPVKVLNLKVFVVMDRDGRIFQTKVRDDSPSFLTNPELKDPEIRENVQAAVDQLFMSVNNLFEVKTEANTTPEQLFSRITQLQLQVSQ